MEYSATISYYKEERVYAHMEEREIKRKEIASKKTRRLSIISTFMSGISCIVALVAIIMVGDISKSIETTVSKSVEASVNEILDQRLQTSSSGSIVNNYTFQFTKEAAEAVESYYRWGLFTNTVLQPSELGYIAIDRDGKQYTAKDLGTELMLLPYLSDSKQMYCSVKFSDSGNWDGNCVFNVYENNKLTLIADTYYDERGTLQVGHQVFPTGENQESNEIDWSLSSYVQSDEKNVESKKVFCAYKDYEQNFAPDNATEDDILHAEEFKEWTREEKLKITFFYCGELQDGKYNDDTGRAYYISYFGDGNLKTLYVGRFKDGKLEDDTGNAVMFGKKDPDQPQYSYFKGVFRNDHYVNSAGKWEEYLTQDRIDELLDEIGMDFEYPLTGLQEPDSATKEKESANALLFFAI